MNNSNNIMISIGVPVYNGDKTLKRALKSIENQTFKRYEVLISDNHSSDSTEKIAKEFCRKNKRFKYIRQRKNIGPIENFLFLIKNTSGKYFTWLSDDDYYENDNLLEELYKLSIKGFDFVFPNVKKIMIKEGNKKTLKVRNLNQIRNKDAFKKHYFLVRYSYIGYQIVNSLFKRNVLNNTDLWLKSYYIKNLPDEEPYLYFLFSRYNWSFVPNIFVVKDMTESNYYKINSFRQFVPLFWNFIACSGIIAQTNYKSHQKIQLIILKFLRNVYIFFDILHHDLITALKA